MSETTPPRGRMAILVIFILAVIAMFLIQKLHHGSKVEDCMLSGRHDCEPLDMNAKGHPADK